MKLLLFSVGDRLLDKQGRRFRMATAPLEGEQLGPECELCTERKPLGYTTAKTQPAAGEEFVCLDCVAVVKGAYEPLVLVQRFTLQVWTGKEWSKDPLEARVFNTRAEAVAEHDRFGRGKHITLVAHRQLAAELKRLREEGQEGF